MRSAHDGNGNLELKFISLDEMWAYVGVRRGNSRNSRWIWTATLEDSMGNRWKDFEVEDRIGVTLLRLLDRLQYMKRCSSDSYGVYICLPVNKRGIGKGGAVNRNEGLHSVLRGRVEQACAPHKGLLQDGWNADIAGLRWCG